MIKVVVIDDHAVIREGLEKIFKKDARISLAGDFDNGYKALQWLNGNNCDIAIIDISMPSINGMDLLKQIHSINRKIAVLVFSVYSEHQFAVRMIKNGAAGYLTKDCQSDEIIDAVLRLSSGRRYLRPIVAELLANEMTSVNNQNPHERLSDREYQIFLMIAEAKTSSQIAEALNLSVKTIGTYRSRVLEKTGFKNNLEIMQYVIDRKLASLPSLCSDLIRESVIGNNAQASLFDFSHEPK